MEFVKLNEGEGTVTMSYSAYTAVHHDSLMLHLLLRTKVVPEDGRTSLLNEFKRYKNLGTGFKMCHSPIPDDEAFALVYGAKPDDSFENVTEMQKNGMKSVYAGELMAHDPVAAGMFNDVVTLGTILMLYRHGEDVMGYIKNLAEEGYCTWCATDIPDDVVWHWRAYNAE